MYGTVLLNVEQLEHTKSVHVSGWDFFSEVFILYQIVGRAVEKTLCGISGLLLGGYITS